MKSSISVNGRLNRKVAVGAAAGLMTVFSLQSSPAQAFEVPDFNLNRIVAGAVGIYTGAVIGSAVVAATAPATGPASVGIGAVAAAATGTVAGKVTLLALENPSTAYKIVSDPIGATVTAIAPKTGVMSTVAKVISWFW